MTKGIIMKKLTTIAAGIALAAGLAGGLASPAQASLVTPLASTRTTVIYDATQTFGWSSPAVQPKHVNLDESANAFVHTWSWAYWTSTIAESHGTLWVNTCTPDCAASHFDYYAATLKLYQPESHGSTRYFSRMELSYYHGWQRTYIFSFNGHDWTGGPS
jgi:hypothetical protein